MAFGMFIKLLVLIQLIGLLAAAFVPQSRHKRIVHGIETSIIKFPYQASLRAADTSKHFCGGTILSDLWIVTSGQCTQGSKSSAQNIYIVVGATNITNGGLRYNLEKIVVHPGFNWEKRKNDISLLKTDQPLQIRETSVFPVTLPTYKTDYLIENNIGLIDVTLSGWGSYHTEESTEEFELSPILRSQDVYILARKSCRRHLGRVNGLLLNEGNLCTSLRNGQGMCNGDAGNPLVTKNGELVGIASWQGFGCGEGYPDVYTRVYPYIPWIWSHLIDGENIESEKNISL